MNAHIDITNVTLTTPRLILRPWKETDAADLYEYASVDGVGQMAGWNPHQSLEESRDILARFIRGRHCFALEHGGKAIGSLGIDEYNEEDYPELDSLQGRELGYVLSKAYWGQGLVPEAVQTIVRYLFETVRLDFLLVAHYAWNRQSRRVIEKCGFAYVKTVERETRYQTVEPSLEYILRRPERGAEHRSARA